jgi:hypothetical protein
MLTLKMLTEDASLISLAKDYWELQSDGIWTYKTEDLAQKYSHPKSRLASIVAKACEAFSPLVQCPSCNVPQVIKSRAQYLSFAKVSERQLNWRRQTECVCNACLEAEREAWLAEMTRQELLKEKAIADWLDKMARERKPTSYSAAPLLDAFLLDGLLRYAGNAFQEDQIDAWENHKLRLCPLTEDTIAAYTQLYSHGWIVPSANSPLGAFSVGADGQIGFSVMRVNWTLAADADGFPPSAVPQILASILQQAKTEDLHEVWNWVCMTELHEQFNYVHDRFQFGSKGWTPKVQEQLKLLLEDCSLAHAKGFIWLTFNGLAPKLMDREYKRPVVYNMIPGGFLRTFQRYQANGWDVKTLPRQSPANEAIYTGHLFDTVLGGGTDLYVKLKGSDFKNGSGETSTVS